METVMNIRSNAIWEPHFHRNMKIPDVSVMLCLFLVFSGIFYAIRSPAQSCLSNGIVLSSQAQVDNFGSNFPGCKRIEGRLTISGKDITNLNGLSQLTSLNDVYIYNNTSLTSLHGLHNVTSMYDLHIGDYQHAGNPLLAGLTGLEALKSISSDLEIYGNPALVSLNGVNNLTFIGRYLSITKNEKLSDIAGLKKLNTAGRGITLHHTALTGLKDLENLTDVRGDIIIANNPLLSNLSGIQNILKDSIRDLIITDNHSLITCDN